MSDPTEPQRPETSLAPVTSIDAWMDALATSPSPRPRQLSTASLLRRVRLEARLQTQRVQTRRALRPAFIAEAVGMFTTASVGVYIITTVSPSHALGGWGEWLDTAGLVGFSSTGAVITLLVTLLGVLWLVGDEAATTG